MHGILKTIACAGVAISLGAPVQAVEIQTARGPVEVAEKPATIAVYDIAAIDTIRALGVDIQGVPDRLFLSQLTEDLEGAEIVGSLFEADLEALNALGPDLVIVGGRSTAQLERTEKVAPTIDMTIWGDDFLGEARSRIEAYGKLFGRDDAAAELLATFDSHVTDAREAAAGKGKALIVMTNGPKISVFGATSRFGWIHKTLDIPQAGAAHEDASHGEAVSFEYIAEVNPDWLIVIDRAAAIGSTDQSAGVTLDNELVHSTTAWKSGQVIYLPSADLYVAGGGAKATLRVLDAMAESFGKAD